jgi:hypothetical protein
VSGQQLLLAPAEPALELELIDGQIADEPTDIAVLAAPAGMEQRNLFGEAERIAARAASASTRRQYASIFRAFGDWLAGELGRPPWSAIWTRTRSPPTPATLPPPAAAAGVRRRRRPRASI